MRIGIFGGTFNPVHNGHLEIARSFFVEMMLDKLIFVPNNVSPFKIGDNDSLDSKHRVKMLELALENELSFEIDYFEINREGTSYTVDTVKYLKSKYPDDELFLLLGADQAANFVRWKDADSIREYVKLVVAKRDAFAACSGLSDAEFKLLSNRQIDISSSQIIENIRSGKSIVGLVPDDVAVYIINNLLYL